MVINRALLLIILFGYGFTQSNIESYTRLQAKITVKNQYNGQVGFGIILMTNNPMSCNNLVSLNSSSTLLTFITITSRFLTAMSSKIYLTSTTSFNTPLSFEASRTQMTNVTSTSQFLFSTTIKSSQMVTGATITQSLPGYSTSLTSQSSLVFGSSTRPGISWSHVIF